MACYERTLLWISGGNLTKTAEQLKSGWLVGRLAKKRLAEKRQVHTRQGQRRAFQSKRAAKGPVGGRVEAAVSQDGLVSYFGVERGSSLVDYRRPEGFSFLLWGEPGRGLALEGAVRPSGFCERRSSDSVSPLTEAGSRRMPNAGARGNLSRYEGLAGDPDERHGWRASRRRRERPGRARRELWRRPEGPTF